MDETKFTAREVAGILGVTTQAIHWAARKGDLPFDTEAGQRRFSASVVMARVESEIQELSGRLTHLQDMLDKYNERPT
jgi:hypothetical protein